MAIGKSKSGRVQIRFGRMKRINPPFDADGKRLEFLRRLNEIPGINLPQDSVDRYPNIALSTLAIGDALEQFLKVIAWGIEEIRVANHLVASVVSQSSKT